MPCDSAPTSRGLITLALLLIENEVKPVEPSLVAASHDQYAHLLVLLKWGLIVKLPAAVAMVDF